jgi:dihydroflavonol-4-reductase
MLTLVTGATGLVGNNVVRLLLARGEAVRVLVRDHPDRRELEGLPVERFLGDIRDPESVEAALGGVVQVVHAAAAVQIGWTGLELLQAVNVEGTRNVARAARLAGARLCHVSSVDALGISLDGPGHEDTPIQGCVECPYVVTKRAAERVVEEEIAAGLDAVLVNPTFMLGAWDWKPSSGRMLLAVASGQGLFAPPGANDFCHVGDVAGGILAALDRGKTGRRYILGGEGLSYREAWTRMARVTGARAPVAVAPGFLLQAAGLAGDLWGRLSGTEPEVNSAATAISCLPHLFSHERASRELGYSPRPMEEGIEDAWKFFVDQGFHAGR